MTLLKKLSLISSLIVIGVVILMIPVLMWLILKQQEINHTFLQIAGGIFLTFAIFGTFTKAIDEIWQKQSLSLWNLIETIIWIALIFFWLGVKFTMTLKG